MVLIHMIQGNVIFPSFADSASIPLIYWYNMKCGYLCQGQVFTFNKIFCHAKQFCLKMRFLAKLYFVFFLMCIHFDSNMY